jgi:NADH-quinone oxidoreductase subunit M
MLQVGLHGLTPLVHTASHIVAAVTPTPAPTTTTPTTSTGIELPSLLLTVIVFAPFVAFIILPFFPERTDDDRSRVRIVGLTGAGVAFFVTAFFAMLGQIGLGAGGGQASANEENYHWLSFSFVSNYHLTADGVSLTLLVLSTLLFGCLFLHAWKVRERVRLYVGLLLVLETAVNGVFCSADYVLFLLFWGMQILPVYLLLRVWGGAERARAASRYLAFSLISLALLTAAVLLIIVKAGQHSSDISQDYQTLLGPVEAAGFWLTFAAFAIALGVFPVHRWLIDTTTQASSGVAAAVSGVVIKLGGYGLMRITLAAFPHASRQFSLVIVALAVISAVWGCIGALSQDDIRRFIGYSTLAQMALVLLAIGAHTSVALEGAIFLMVAHGLAVGILTLLAGSVEERARTRSIRALGGLVAQTPRLAGLWMFAVFSVIGVPLLAGFVADLMLFTGSFPAHRIATVLVMATLVITTAGLVWTAHRLFFGPLKESLVRARDVTTLELTYLLPLIAMVLLFGLRPGAVTQLITNGVLQITTRLAGG